ncbi:MAG: adenylyl-sulfate kinase [Promethearchaeota archaeon]|nr:MAG: adenylyl-sulfate kinase [Candidatus Lokiarchaeota archaeon]
MEHKGFTLWFTGLPCSGKTTIADMVAEDLRAQNMKVERLDGDIVRKGLTRDLGFTKQDRAMNIERVTFVAKLLTRNGVAVLATFVSPYNEIRHKSRAEIGDYVLVYVKCSTAVCEERDVKGMYAKARAGEIKDFTGVDDPFEEPDDADIIIETDKQTTEESKKIILDALEKMGYLPNHPQI